MAHTPWRERIPARLQDGPRRHRFEAAWVALPKRPLEGLAQVQESGKKFNVHAARNSILQKLDTVKCGQVGPSRSGPMRNVRTPSRHDIV